MDRPVLLNVLREYDAALRANGATGLYIFGSRARGTERPDSDLDLFIDYDRASRFNAFDLVGIKQFLEQDLGMHVDVTTHDGLHPMLRADIERAAVRVFYSPVSNIGDIRSLEEGSDEGSIVLDIDEVGLDAFLQQFI